MADALGFVALGLFMYIPVAAVALLFLLVVSISLVPLAIGFVIVCAAAPWLVSKEVFYPKLRRHYFKSGREEVWH